MLVFSEPYFDRHGMILAMDGPEPVGFVHAGFGSNTLGSRLDMTHGVICVVMVRPDYRRQGIGRELVKRAEEFLISRGAKSIYAGESDKRGPFYLGLYGGSQSVGFLESDPLAQPFFEAIGYVKQERHILFRRDITQKNEPFDARLVTIRRKMQLGLMDHPATASWWWMTRVGRFDSLSFALLPNANSNAVVARVTAWGMDLLSVGWRQRTVGLTDLIVNPSERRKAYARALLLEVIRRMRDELVTQLDMSCNETNTAAMAFCHSLGFEQIDTGIVYAKRGMGASSVAPEATVELEAGLEGPPTATVVMD